MNTFLVSIIVPVYNVSIYLHQCVDSILQQTYKNIEVILVDDGSPDECPKICDEYSMQDNRVHVVHKKNGGPSSARKAGVEISKGEFVMIVDGDDWLDELTIEQCVESINKFPSVDCVSFSYVREYPNKSIKAHIFDEDKIFFDGECEKYVYRRLFGLLGQEMAHPERMDAITTCWGKLYSKSLISNGVYYDTKDVASSEDALFNMFAMDNCKCFVYINKCFYHYRKNANSITASYKPNMVAQWNNLFNIMSDIIKEKNLGTGYNEALNSRIAFSIIGLGFNELSNNSGGFFKTCKNIKQILSQKRYRKAIENTDFKFLPFKWKCFIICCKMKLTCCVFLFLKAMFSLKSKK